MFHGTGCNFRRVHRGSEVLFSEFLRISRSFVFRGLTEFQEVLFSAVPNFRRVWSQNFKRFCFPNFRGLKISVVSEFPNFRGLKISAGLQISPGSEFPIPISGFGLPQEEFADSVQKPCIIPFSHTTPGSIPGRSKFSLKC